MGSFSSLSSNSNKLRLYVEDPRTKDYFAELFYPNSKIMYELAGGRQGVEPLVKASWQKDSGLSQAYGWIDRDFGDDNIANWEDPNTHLFCGTCHEIENYLLDWEAMANCDMNIGRTQASLENVARNFANSILYHVVCCQVIYKLASLTYSNFPSYPELKQKISDFNEAINYLNNQFWIASNTNNQAYDTITPISTYCSLENLTSLAQTAEVELKRALASAVWTKLFPGKEIFEFLCQTLFHGAEGKPQDFVKSIARYQRHNNRIPQELDLFMTELQSRA